MQKAIRCVGIVLLLIGAVTYGFGQATATGTILGNVTDNTKALVVGAQIVVTSSATGLTRTTTTNDSGNYRFDQMPVGTYTVKVSKSGFATTAITSLELLVGQTATGNFTLKPGTATEVIEVTETAPLVDTTKTSVSQAIPPADVEEIPMLGRDVANLAYLAPGVRQTDSYDPTKNRYAILSVNGQGGRNINVTVNGVDNKDSTVGGPVMQLPLEAVEEFVISTQRFSAANGKSEGAAINMVTKSGSNALHGSLYGFFRDQALNHIDKEAQINGSGKSPYSRQQFGGSIGGPIRKDKAFVFFAFERQREHTSLTEDSNAYSQLTMAATIIPEIKPATVIPTPFFENRYNGRLDFKFNDRHSAYLSYSSQDNNSLNDQSDGTGDLTGGNTTTNHVQIANFTVNSVLTTSLVNTFTFGFQYWNNAITSDINLPYVTFPSAWFGTNTNVPQQSFQRKWQFRDDLAKTAGNHTFKMGVDYIWEPSLGGYFTYNHTLEIDFKKNPIAILGDPVTYPQGLSTAGLIASMSLAAGDPSTNVPGGTKQIGLYFQDDWKVNNRLTLNLGVRWDKDINLIGGSSVENSRTYQELVAIGSPYAAKVPHDDNLDLSPRIGFAYDLTGRGKHLLRGGFGLYYGNVFQNIPMFMQQQANPTIYQGVFSITPGTNCADSCVPGTNILLQNWHYGIDPLPTTPPPATQLADGSTGRLMDSNYRNPYTEQFNFGYQWALTEKSVFEAEYIHVLGLHENKTVTINPVDPATGERATSALFEAAGVPVLGSIRDEQSINRSRYDGLNLSYRKQLVKWYSLTANYTLSRAVGWNVNGASSFRNYPFDPRDLWNEANFGPSNEDERHHITLASVIKFPAGFQVAPVMQFGSARPYNLSEGFDILGIGSGHANPLIVPTNSPTDYHAYENEEDPTVIAACLAANTCKMESYNSKRGDPVFQLDLRVSNNIKLGEKRNLELIFQAFNLTNKTNYGNNYDGVVTSDNFMQPNGYFAPTSTTIPRAFVGEFGFRFSF